MKKLILSVLMSLIGATALWAQTGSLSVLVLAGDSPVVSAWVSAIGDGHGHDRPHFEGITNPEGLVQFPNIPAMEYHVTAGMPGVPPAHADVEVLEGSTANLTLTLPNFDPAPRIIVMPPHVFFGPVGIGTTFTRVVRVENRGQEDLTVSLAVTGEAFGLNSPTEFTLIPSPMGNNAEVLVTFSPTAAGAYEGELTITSNDPDHGTIIVDLNGLGAQIITGGLSVDVIFTDSLGESTPVDSAVVRVSFIRDHGGPRPHHVLGMTDAAGHLSVDALPVGIYNVNASKRGVGFASEIIEITADQTTFVTLSLVPGHDGPGGPHFEIVELAGTAVVTAADSTHPDRLFYALDVDADGVIDYRLNFGPPWYNPPSGAVRPSNGDEITLVGALMSHGDRAIVHVHILNDLDWWDPRGGRPGEHGGDGGGRAEGFGCDDSDLTWFEVGGTVTDIQVRGSVFYGIDHNSDGQTDYVIDFGDNISLGSPLLPTVGQTVSVVGGMLTCSPDDVNAEWVIVYEVDGQFVRMPGDTDGLDPILGVSVNPSPTPVVTSHLIATNYPNPFNPTTTIEFSTPVTGLVNVTVFDVLGRQVATLVNDNLTAGTYTTQFDAASLPSGMYMYRLTLNNQQIVNRMLLLK